MAAPQPATSAALPLGTRVVLVDVNETTARSRYVHDRRIASAPYVDETGKPVIRVVSDADWHAWLDDADRAAAGECPRGEPWPAELVWTE